jgi:hypothetical protein
LRRGRVNPNTPAAPATLGTVLKYHEDQQRAHQVGLEALLDRARERAAP